MTDQTRHLLGMLTPSSNTVLEPLTAAMLASVPDTTAHFGRFKVTEISLGASALGQFTNEPMLDAAALLADARVQTICWNGTSSGWMGFDSDKALLAAIKERTGVEACSSVLALNEILETTNARKIAFVTPYLDEIQERIVANYTDAGFEVVAEMHLGDRGNFSYSTYDEATIAKMCREVAKAGPDAISVFCTNFRGAPVAQAIEEETGIPVYDTVATALWKAMKVAGANPRNVKGWGSLFQNVV